MVTIDKSTALPSGVIAAIVVVVVLTSVGLIVAVLTVIYCHYIKQKSRRFITDEEVC